MSLNSTASSLPFQYAKSYADRGWHVLKLEPNSKRPATINGVYGASVDEEKLRQWFEGEQQGGIGIATGAVSGIFVVDVDPRNGGDASFEDLCSKHGYKPDTLCARTGQNGMHYFFQYPPQGARSCVIGQGVDIISDGKYVVAAPTSLNNGYRWLDDDPIDTPEIVPAPAPSWLLEAIRPESTQFLNGVMRQGKPVPVQTIDEATRKRLESALASVDADDYHLWVRMGLALRCLGDLGRNLWLNYGQRSMKFDQQASDAKWKSFAPVGISFESVFFEAKQRGWNAVDEVAPEEIKIKTVQKKVADLTCDISTVPGVLGKVVDWYNATSPVPQPLFAVQTALAFGSVVCGRNFKTSSDNFSALYFLNVAESGTGKEHCKTAVERLLVECGMDQFIGPSRFSSDTAIHDALSMCPKQLVVTDELAQIIAQSKGRSGGLISSALRVLMELWGRCDGVQNPPAFSHTGRKQSEIAEQQGRKVYNPSLTFVSMSTVKSFFAAIGADAIENGFLNRFIVAVSDVKPQSIVDNLMRRQLQPKEVPSEVIEWVKSINEWVNSSAGDLGELNMASIKAQPIVVQLSKQAWERMREFEGWIMRGRLEGSKNDIEEMYNRLLEQALRVALIVSISLGEREIGFEAVRWACQYIEFLSNQNIEAILSHISGSDFEATCKQVYAFIEKSGHKGKTTREITKGCRKFRQIDLKNQGAVLEFLAAHMGVVKSVRVSASGRGASFPIFVAAVHAEDEVGE